MKDKKDKKASGMKGTSWGEVDTKKYGDAWYNKVKIFSFPEGESVTLRFVGKAHRVIYHWIPAISKKEKKGAGASGYTLLCPSNNGEKCPCEEVGYKKREYFYAHAINRDKQENKPENTKKSKPPKGQSFLTKDDKFWTPMTLVRIPPSIATKFKTYSQKNQHVDKKTGKLSSFSIEHPKYGMDLEMSFDGSQSGAGMYDIQKKNVTPLTDEEKNYLMYDLDSIFGEVPSYEDVLGELRRAYNSELITSEDCTNIPKLKELLGVSKKKKSSDDEDEEDEPDTDDESDDESDDDGDIEDDASDDDDEDTDESDDEDDSDDDEEEYDNDDEEDKSDDDEDEDESDDDEDEEDAKQKKSKKVKKDKKAKNSKDKSNKDKSNKPKCYGKYKGKKVCADCDYKTKCMKKFSESDD